MRKKLIALLTLLLCFSASIATTGIGPASAATHSHTGAAPAVHMQVKNSSGTVLCKVYNTSASSKPTAAGCPAGNWIEQLFDGNWKQIRPNRNVKVPSGSTSGGSYSHTGAAPAVHMQVKNSSGTVLCKVYNTSASSKPTAAGCPAGNWIEQLFDGNWKQIRPNRDVKVPSGSTSGGTKAPYRNPESKFIKIGNSSTPRFNDNRLTKYVPSGLHAGNTGNGDGNFRISCEYSHFNYDDPILEPGRKGAAHLHMFFGNTRTDANSTPNSLRTSGGGSCTGFELNRSAYWTPAVQDGKGNAVVPEQVIVYYKTNKIGSHTADEIVEIPRGLKMIAGRFDASNKYVKKTSGFKELDHLFWSCGESGTTANKSLNIPANCNGHKYINATIYFPECWDGKNLAPTRNGPHVAQVGREGTCPSSHPKRMPRLAILMYFPNQSTSGWTLSSDHGSTKGPGGTLHADFIAAWEPTTIRNWTNKCLKEQKNCGITEFGAHTGTSRQLRSNDGSHRYQGDSDRVEISKIPKR